MLMAKSMREVQTIAQTQTASNPTDYFESADGSKQQSEEGRDNRETETDRAQDEGNGQRQITINRNGLNEEEYLADGFDLRSEKEIKCGFAVVEKRMEPMGCGRIEFREGKAHEQLSIFSIEAKAVVIALKWIKETEEAGKEAIIATDSESVR